MGKTKPDTHEFETIEFETFDVTVQVQIHMDPNRKVNSLLMRMADCEVEVTDQEDGKVVGYAGGAIGGRLFATVGRYTVSAAASTFWKAVRAKLEEMKPDLWEKPPEAETEKP